MSKKIFISHSVKDRQQLESLRERLREILEQNNITAQGENVSFIDPMSESINPSESFREIIKNQIQSSNEVVLIATDDSLSSQWVNYEIGMADALGKPIVVIGKKGTGKTTLLDSLDRFRLIELDAKANK